MNEKLIRAYFDQGVQYFSEGSEEFLIISKMHPTHAGNAAERLLREAEFWMKEMDRCCLRAGAYRHMANSALFQALNARASA